MKKITNTRLKNFRRKIKDILDEELALRDKLRHLYDQFILDAQDDDTAERQVRQMYFSIQKYRMAKLMEKRLEFHPFFTDVPFEVEDLEDGEDDGII